MTNKVNFNLDDEEEIHFKMTIKGETNLPNVKPLMRFIISENIENGLAVVLPAQPTEEGVMIKIPSLKHVFSENKDYIGKMEIIVGNRYFAPMAMNIGFTKSLDVQFEMVSKTGSPTFHVEQIKTSGKSQTVISPTKKKPNNGNSVLTENKSVKKEVNVPETDSLDDISDEILNSLETKIIERVVEKPKKINENKTTIKQKEEIKNLLRKALR